MSQDKSVNMKDRAAVSEALLEEAMKHPGVKEVMEVYEASQLIYASMPDLSSLERINITTASNSSTESL